jgi:Lrp/AsnC family leucine-responsive transcriptional regulator
MDSYKLDPTDLKILNLLQRDGLMTYKQIARETHKSLTPVAERVNRLKELGYIKNTVALIDLKKVKTVFTVFPFIQLTDHREPTYLCFLQAIEGHPEIMECYHIMGHFDFILKIVLSDITAYNSFLYEHISCLDCVQRVESYPMLAEIKKETAHPL